jgi:hypothetical protein
MRHRYFFFLYQTSIPGAMQRALVLNEFAGGHVQMPCTQLAMLFYNATRSAVDDPATRADVNRIAWDQAKGNPVQRQYILANYAAQQQAQLDLYTTAGE